MIPDLDTWLTELMEGQPPIPKQYELHCHPDVSLAVREAAIRQDAEQWPPPLHTGKPGLFGSAAIVVKPDLGPGGWELRENGQVVKSGRLGASDAPA